MWETKPTGEHWGTVWGRNSPSPQKILKFLSQSDTFLCILRWYFKGKLKRPQWLRQLKGRCIIITVAHTAQPVFGRGDWKQTKLKFIITIKWLHCYHLASNDNNNQTYPSWICQFINNLWTSDEWLVYSGAPPGEYIVHPVTCDVTSDRLDFAW